jgi:hypothetical protein
MRARAAGHGAFPVYTMIAGRSWQCEAKGSWQRLEGNRRPRSRSVACPHSTCERSRESVGVENRDTSGSSCASECPLLCPLNKRPRALISISALASARRPAPSYELRSRTGRTSQPPVPHSRDRFAFGERIPDGVQRSRHQKRRPLVLAPVRTKLSFPSAAGLRWGAGASDARARTSLPWDWRWRAGRSGR